MYDGAFFVYSFAHMGLGFVLYPLHTTSFLAPPRLYLLSLDLASFQPALPRPIQHVALVSPFSLIF